MIARHAQRREGQRAQHPMQPIFAAISADKTSNGLRRRICAHRIRPSHFSHQIDGIHETGGIAVRSLTGSDTPSKAGCAATASDAPVCCHWLRSVPSTAIHPARFGIPTGDSSERSKPKACLRRQRINPRPFTRRRCQPMQMKWFRTSAALRRLAGSGDVAHIPRIFGRDSGPGLRLASALGRIEASPWAHRRPTSGRAARLFGHTTRSHGYRTRTA